MEPLETRERVGITAILVLVFCLVAYDIWSDWGTGVSSSHLFAEGFVGVLAILGLGLVWMRSITLSKQVERLQGDLHVAREESNKWKAENAHLLEGLGTAFEKQFGVWGLTSAEKEIALLLLKGLSLKEIAQARNTSERTVRQQTIAIYSKGGLSGRAALSAFFLEDLFLPMQERA